MIIRINQCLISQATVAEAGSLNRFLSQVYYRFGLWAEVKHSVTVNVCVNWSLLSRINRENRTLTFGRILIHVTFHISSKSYKIARAERLRFYRDIVATREKQ